MKHKLKLKGKLQTYLQLSMLLGILLAVVDIWIYTLDIKAGVLIFTQILNQLFTDHRCLAQIGILIFAFTDLCLCIGSREEAQNFLELRSGFEEEINFILQIFNSNAAAAVWRHNMDIEIPFRLRSATLSRQAEEQIAFTENVV